MVPGKCVMSIKTCISDPDNVLEPYRPCAGFDAWELVISGCWSEGPFHSGHIAYFIANLGHGVWILDAVERNAELDGVTEEEVEEGCLNDDQIQAMWGITLEEAQNEIYQHIVAVCEDAPPGASSKEIGALLYDAVKEESGKIVDESDVPGLLDLQLNS